MAQLYQTKLSWGFFASYKCGPAKAVPEFQLRQYEFKNYNLVVFLYAFPGKETHFVETRLHISDLCNFRN